MSDPYWAKGSLAVTEPGMRLAVAKAAQKVVGDRAAVGYHEDDFWVPATGDDIEVTVRVRLTRAEVEAEFPEQPGGGPERRLTERRHWFGRRHGSGRKSGAGHPDARSGKDRRGPQERRAGDGLGAESALERIRNMAFNKLYRQPR